MHDDHDDDVDNDNHHCGFRTEMRKRHTSRRRFQRHYGRMGLTTQVYTLERYVEGYAKGSRVTYCPKTQAALRPLIAKCYAATFSATNMPPSKSRRGGLHLSESPGVSRAEQRIGRPRLASQGKRLAALGSRATNRCSLGRRRTSDKAADAAPPPLSPPTPSDISGQERETR